MPPLTVSSKVISETSGIPLRQVQTWTDAEVLIPEEGTEAPGRGGSRQYPIPEAEVASLLGAIAHKGLSVGEAKGIAETLRSMVCAPDELGFKGLDQARELNRYLNACLALGSPHEFERNLEVIAKLKARWEKVQPIESNLRKVEAWIILELARRDEANPIMVLYRGPDEAWCYDFWAFLSFPERSSDPQSYRLGDVSIKVERTSPGVFPADRDCGEQFDEVLIELKSHAPNHHEKLRGGYFIMPRNVYATSNSKS